MEGQCFGCEHEFSISEAEVVRVFRYRPTVLAVRAAEENRLTGLDLTAIMYDANVKLATRDLLAFETNRELLRMRRYGGCFTIAVLSFELHGRTHPVFREWRAETIRSLAGLLTSSLRPLDLVSRLDVDRLGILLLETGAEGAESVRERLFKSLDEFTFTSDGGQELTPRWTPRTWTDSRMSLEAVLAFLDEEPT